MKKDPRRVTQDMDDDMKMHIAVHATSAEAVRWYARHEIGLGEHEPAWEEIEQQLARQSRAG